MFRCATLISLSLHLYKKLEINENKEISYLDILTKSSETFIFEKLFCSFVLLFNKIWKKKKANYMDFQKILKETDKNFKSIFKKKPKNLDLFEEFCVK
jgi:hypothetical protein